MSNNIEGLRIEEKEPKSSNGLAMLCIITLALIASIIIMVIGIATISGSYGTSIPGVFMLVFGIIYLFFGWVFYMGLKIVKPNEALVLTLFGRYYGTIKREGFYYVNPFVTSVNPAAGYTGATSGATEQPTPPSLGAMVLTGAQGQAVMTRQCKKVSLKVSTINNEKQKINDQLGNPIIIGIVVIWRVVNTARAVFDVDNYKEFLSIQCDSALRDIVRLYPYDSAGHDNEKSLRGSSMEVAGLEIIEARITHLSYSEEIAAAMLQRQQASAIIDARQMIVEGAVSMVEMALDKLSKKDIVHLDEERKAAMVSNLLVVLCGNRDAQPVVNSGSIY